MKVMFIYDFASDYTNKSKPISSTIRKTLKATYHIKYKETFNPNLAGQGSLSARVPHITEKAVKHIQNILHSQFMSQLFSHKSLIRLWITSAGRSSDASAKTFSTSLVNIFRKRRHIQCDQSLFCSYSFTTLQRILILKLDCNNDKYVICATQNHFCFLRMICCGLFYCLAVWPTM